MKKLITSLLFSCATLCSISLMAVMVTLAWFTGPSGKADKIIDGEIGLRSYFYSGDGKSERTAYEIVNSTQLYYLTRLQNLGIFSDTTYFQLGHETSTGVYQTIVGEDPDTHETVWGNYIDMSNINDFYPIGNEGSPFIGNFNGNGMIVKNLTVKGHPEDMGIFGYVAHEGSITGLVCDTLTIDCSGYADDPDTTFQLYNPNLTYVLEENINDISGYMSLDYYPITNGAAGTVVPLKTDDLINIGYPINNINASGNYTEVTDASNNTLYYYNGFLKYNKPSDQDKCLTLGTGTKECKVEYTWKSSSSLIKSFTHPVLQQEVIGIDLTPLATAPGDNGAFNSGGSMELDARVSLIASIRYNAVVYSRVIQSYVIKFFSNNATSFEDANNKYSMAIYCDYVDGKTTYHHGNNVGFLVGHLDGSISNSYVYNGEFSFNNASGSIIAIPTETDSALVGEIGQGVVNDIDPEMSQVSDGDTGVINFSSIYGGIRRDFQRYDTGYIGRDSRGKNYVSYDSTIIENNDYIDYLRFGLTDTKEKIYITPTSAVFSGTDYVGVAKVSMMENPDNVFYPVVENLPADFNAIDFIPNKVIEDKEGGEDKLGVFKIISSYEPTAQFDTNDHIQASYDLSIGNSRIMKRKTPVTKIYFSTAEWDRVKDGEKTFNPLRATSIPTYTDSKSFGRDFKRDYNYCFELDLAQMGLPNAPTQNYMFNTNSPFLRGYLSSFLINKFGRSVDWGNMSFGFMFRSSENVLLQDGLSSYMPVKKPTTPQNFGVGRYFPPDSIVFDINNEHGANVSVVGSGQDITIYSYDPTGQDLTLTALYTMKAASSNSIDSKRYFTYNYLTGATGEEMVIEESEQENPNQLIAGEALYGHIFTLPPGHYAIGSDDENNKANIYYLAVQGQTSGTIAATDQTSIGNSIVDVDFLTSAPDYTNQGTTFSSTKDQATGRYINSFSGCRASLSFSGEFNSNSGVFQVKTVHDQDDVEPDDHKNYLQIYFNISSGDCLDYMYIQCNAPIPHYYVNDTPFTKITNSYKEKNS